MKFKRPHLEAEFQLRTEPELRQAWLDFEAASETHHWPPPQLTCCGRTVEENQAVNGVFTSLHLWEVDSNGVLRTRAVDASVWPYTDGELDAVEAWWREYLGQRGGIRGRALPDGRWEFMLHNSGTGRHIHVGIRRRPKEKHHE